jgi:hypothetical protein
MNMTSSRIRPLAQFAFVAVIAVLLASCAEQAQIPQKAFEGTITETIQVPGIANMIGARSDSSHAPEDPSTQQGLAMLGMASNMTVKMYVRGDKVAYEMSLLGNLIKVKSIIDRNARTLTMLMPNQTAIVRNLRDFDSARGRIEDSMQSHMGMFDSLSHMLPKPTGKKETIEGIEAEEYRASVNGMDVGMGLSSDNRMKAFEIVRDAFIGKARTGTGGFEQIFEMMRPIGGKIPVKFETMVGGKLFAKGGL